MGLDNTVMTVVGVAVAAIAAVVMAAMIGWNERSAAGSPGRRAPGPAEPGSGPGLSGDRP